MLVIYNPKRTRLRSCVIPYSDDGGYRVVSGKAIHSWGLYNTRLVVEWRLSVSHARRPDEGPLQMQDEPTSIFVAKPDGAASKRDGLKRLAELWHISGFGSSRPIALASAIRSRPIGRRAAGRSATPGALVAAIAKGGGVSTSEAVGARPVLWAPGAVVVAVHAVTTFVREFMNEAG